MRSHKFLKFWTSVSIAYPLGTREFAKAPTIVYGQWVAMKVDNTQGINESFEIFLHSAYSAYVYM